MKTLRFTSSTSQYLSNLWQSLRRVIARYTEIRVWQKSDRQGNLYWHGYNPNNGDYVSFGTEAEIRMWIEEHYYR
ncbi:MULTISPECIES: hypothetical protein [Trichocoleus]|uniref:Uncharacterized protein n=1 Tax=Trichocoleus desertorum GB2-A4 TaxID=2933944 RepID=A0ABV0J5H4_9CYAN|nr:hypothetical protein [Trichocoleus sp. FACHB-46]MBD1863866.1 hypothetical protein [Trichocoleus sp. FACHB-46]